jgi:uncharacterized membrane protein
MMQAKDWILWNVFLAVIPVGAAYALAWGVQKFFLRPKRAPWFYGLPLLLLALVWFAFLPNSCYLLTEWRHFLLDGHFAALRDAAESNHVYMIQLARWSCVFLMYTAVGALSFALSIRPIARVLRRIHASLVLWAVPFFFLTSLGVYLGLIVRLNSWDLVSRPDLVLLIAVHALLNPPLLKVITIFALLLWMLYEIVDIWIDGLTLRLTQRRKTIGQN